jgi:MoaA/NifB/PqqE/SkfB family radical SAM enzyme
MDCPDISELEAGDFGLRLASQRRPLRATLEVTQRCNNVCTHCYLDPGRVAPPPDPPLAFLVDLLDALAAEETLWITMTGGEPLLREDFPELYLAAKRRGFVVSVFTNGRLISDDMADLFREYPPRALSVSLYGATAETYENVSRVPGSYDEAMAGIRRLHARGVALNLKTMALRSNVHELDAMFALAESLGCRLHYDPTVNATIHGKTHVLVERLDPEAVVELDRRNASRSAAWEERCRGDALLPGNRLLRCAAGVTGLAVDCLGTAHLCLSHRSVGWPLDRHDLRGSLHRIFYDEFPAAMAQTVEGPYPCGECRLASICQVCAPLRAQEVGEVSRPSPHACAVARLRARQFGSPNDVPAEVAAELS